MYESPIEKIVQHIQENLIKQEEDHLMAQITETVGYQINKEELIKALKYDRNQYHIGFEDARKMYERAKGEWIPVASVKELPKKCLWVTRKGENYCFVELIGWDSDRNCRTEDGGFRCSSDLEDVVAYMPYFEPEPYKDMRGET